MLIRRVGIFLITGLAWIAPVIAADALPPLPPLPSADQTPAPEHPPATEPSAMPAEPAAPAALPPTDTPPIAETVPEPPRDLFKEALANVYASHPVLKAEREALKAVDETVAQAISGFRPDALIGYSRGRERASVSKSDWNYADATSKSLTVIQPVFSGGESWASYKSARDRVKAGRATLKDVEQQVLYNAVVAYTDLVEKQLVLKLNQNNVDVLSKQMDATQQRFDVGELTRTDVAQSEARLAQARADERQALGNVEVSRAAFRRAIGFDPPDALELPPVPPTLPQNMTEAIELAKAANPTLEAARYNETAATTDVDVRTAAVLPDVNVQGTMDRSEGAGGAAGARSFDNDALMVNVTIPLYQSGAEWSRIREAKNQAAQAKFATLDTGNAVVENATRAWQDYNTAKAVIASTSESVNAAEVALAGVREENQIGTRTILDVLDAEQELFITRVNLVAAQRAEKVQAYQLLAAVGRLDPQHLGLPVKVYDPTEHYDDVKYQLIGF